jgi:hypothetical protein
MLQRAAIKRIDETKKQLKSVVDSINLSAEVKEEFEIQLCFLSGFEKFFNSNYQKSSKQTIDENIKGLNGLCCLISQDIKKHSKATSNRGGTGCR